MEKSLSSPLLPDQKNEQQNQKMKKNIFEKKQKNVSFSLIVSSSCVFNYLFLNICIFCDFGILVNQKCFAFSF